MARRAYSAQNAGGGFQPIQLSTAQIQRMTEDSNRVINNMERLRKVELQRGMETLQAMKENAAAEADQRERNFNITQQNLNVRKLELEFDRQKAEKDAAQGLQQSLAAAIQSPVGADFKSLLTGLAEFSKGAGALASQIEVQQEKERQFTETLFFMGLSPEAQNDPLFKSMEEGLRIQGLKYSQAISLAEAQGQEPNSIARAREGNPANRYNSKKSSANWMLMNGFESYLNNMLSDTNYQFDFNGQSVTFASARTNPRLMQVVQRFAFKKFVDENNLNLDSRYIQDGLNHVQKLFTANESMASQIEIKNSYARQVQTGFSTLRNNPEAVLENAANVFNMWSTNPTLGFEGAHNNWNELATDLKPDGSFRFDINKLLAADVDGSGRTYLQAFPGRASKMIAARDDAYLQQQAREQDIEKIGYRNDLKAIKEFLAVPKNNTQANLDAAVKGLGEKWPQFGGADSELRQRQETGSIEAQAKIKLSEQLRSIPSDLLTINDVFAAYRTDPTLGAEIDKRYQGKKNFENSDNFKEVVKTFQTTANGITTIGTAKPNDMASLQLQVGMKEELRKRVANRVKAGESAEAAVLIAGTEIENEVKQGFKNKASRYYRKLDGPGGTATFPNLNVGVISKAEDAARRWKTIRTQIDAKGLETVLNTPGALYSKEVGQQLLQTANTAYFKLPEIAHAVAGLTNGGDPFTIANRAQQALGLPRIPVPASFTSVKQKASPELMKILQKAPSYNNSARALGSGNTFNPSSIPNNMGPVIQKAAQIAAVNPAYIAALAEIESGFDPNKPSYNNSSFGVMQINRAAHPAFFAQQNWKDPQANVNYGAQYYANLLKRYKDPVAAAMAYNAGPGNYDAYVRGEKIDDAVKNEMINHGKKFAKVMFKYGGGSGALNNPNLMRTGHSRMQLISSASNYNGMDTSGGPDAGRNACVWAVNKVMRSAGMQIPWGDSVYVPEVKRVLDQVGRQVSGPVPGAIAIMQDNHPTDPYPHMGIVGSDGMIISNSSSRAKFDWRGTPQEYEQKYGKPNLYYLIN